MTRTKIRQFARSEVLLAWFFLVYLEEQILLLGGLHHRSVTQLLPGLQSKRPYQFVVSSFLATALDFAI